MGCPGGVGWGTSCPSPPPQREERTQLPCPGHIHGGAGEGHGWGGQQCRTFQVSLPEGRGMRVRRALSLAVI